jgi:hypothetical protein
MCVYTDTHARELNNNNNSNITGQLENVIIEISIVQRIVSDIIIFYTYILFQHINRLLSKH